nr:hypothetical protein [Bacillaceae bacterium]
MGRKNSQEWRSPGELEVHFLSLREFGNQLDACLPKFEPGFRSRKKNNYKDHVLKAIRARDWGISNDGWTCIKACWMIRSV